LVSGNFVQRIRGAHKTDIGHRKTAGGPLGFLFSLGKVANDAGTLAGATMNPAPCAGVDMSEPPSPTTRRRRKAAFLAFAALGCHAAALSDARTDAVSSATFSRLEKSLAQRKSDIGAVRDLAASMRAEGRFYPVVPLMEGVAMEREAEATDAIRRADASERARCRFSGCAARMSAGMTVSSAAFLAASVATLVAAPAALVTGLCMGGAGSAVAALSDVAPGLLRKTTSR
jgi:hypothetical protein